MHIKKYTLVWSIFHLYIGVSVCWWIFSIMVLHCFSTSVLMCMESWNNIITISLFFTLKVVWRKLGDNPNGTGPNGTNGTNGSSNGSGSNQSQRPPAPARYSNSTVNPPAKPAGYSTPPYSSGSTGSLERKGI